jgi:hypothetical protein
VLGVVVMVVMMMANVHRHDAAVVLGPVLAGRIFVGEGRRGDGREERGARRSDQ